MILRCYSASTSGDLVGLFSPLGRLRSSCPCPANLPQVFAPMKAIVKSLQPPWTLQQQKQHQHQHQQSCLMVPPLSSSMPALLVLRALKAEQLRSSAVWSSRAAANPPLRTTRELVSPSSSAPTGEKTNRGCFAASSSADSLGIGAWQRARSRHSTTSCPEHVGHTDRGPAPQPGASLFYALTLFLRIEGFHEVGEAGRWEAEEVAGRNERNKKTIPFDRFAGKPVFPLDASFFFLSGSRPLFPRWVSLVKSSGTDDGDKGCTACRSSSCRWPRSHQFGRSSPFCTPIFYLSLKRKAST